MLSQANEIGISLEFIEGVDGRKGRPDIGKLNFKKGAWDWKDFELPNPHIGAVLSHRRAIEKFLSQTEHPYCVLFEDDAQFGSELFDQLNELVQVSGWDMIKLENRHKKRRGFTVKKMSWGGELISGTKSDIGATALLWNQTGAKKFLKSTETIQYPIDILFTHYTSWDLDMLDIVPPIVTQKDYPSNIGDREPPKDKPSYRRKSLYRTIGQSAWSVFRLARAGRVWISCKWKNQNW